MAEPAGGGEHDERDVDVAEDGELVGLFDETIATLREGHLAISVVLYLLYLELYSTHDPRKGIKLKAGGDWNFEERNQEG